MELMKPRRTDSRWRPPAPGTPEPAAVLWLRDWVSLMTVLPLLLLAALGLIGSARLVLLSTAVSSLLGLIQIASLTHRARSMSRTSALIVDPKSQRKQDMRKHVANSKGKSAAFPTVVRVILGLSILTLICGVIFGSGFAITLGILVTLSALASIPLRRAIGY